MAITLTTAQKTILDLFNTTLDTEYSSGLLNPDSSVNAAAIGGYSGLSPTNQDQMRAVMRQAIGGFLHQLEDWTAASLINSWVYFGSPYNTAAYYKDPFGVVHLRGLIKSGAVGSTAFVLPSGYRPPARFLCGGIASQSSNQVSGRVDIDTSGNVIIQGSSSGSGAVYDWFSLDGVYFRTS